ncbi:MAG: HAD-IC family P-type ATPase, partial [Pseudomonadota bacterium]
AAKYYAPGVHLLAAIALAGWLFATGDVRLSLQIATAVLIITCPCALALAVPTVHTVATGRLFGAGIFLKDGAALERLSEIDTIVFDKTGTLTDGVPRMTDAPSADHPGWPVAAALAKASRHPYSRAIADAADRMGIVPAGIDEAVEYPGLGVEATIEGFRVRLGRPSWIGCSEASQVAVELPDGEVLGFSFSESLRPGAEAVVRTLREQGHAVELLSGDNLVAVARVAEALGISAFRAELTPTEKHAHVEVLAQHGRKVLMVGDGLNDNPALAAAHASMSPSNAMDATQNVADLVYTGKGLDAVRDAISLARTARQRALQSFGIAAVYNAIAIPLAFAGLVVPLVAALAMSGSSIAVILNALRLRRTA